MATRQEQLEYKYVIGKATVEEMRELFKFLKMTDQEIEFRIAVERDRIDFNSPLEVIN